MAKAILVGGNPVTANLITPVDCEPGDVVFLGGGTATRPIVAVGGGGEGTLVSFALGGGVYQMEIDSEIEFVPGENVLSNGGLASDVGTHFGWVAEVNTNGVKAFHAPNGLEN
jgi:hypothetical protein